MSMVCTKFGGSSNIALCDFVAYSVYDLLADAHTTKKKWSVIFAYFDHYAPIGSTATVNNSGSIVVYMLFSEGWKEM